MGKSKMTSSARTVGRTVVGVDHLKNNVLQFARKACGMHAVRLRDGI